MSSLQELLNHIQSQVVEEKLINPEEDVNLGEIFQRSIHQTLEEISSGANSENFPDFVVINFIILAAHEGFSASEIKEFIGMISAP